MHPNRDSVDYRGLHPLSLLFEIAHRFRLNLIPAIFASFSVFTGGVVGIYIGSSIFTIAFAISLIRFMTYRYHLSDTKLLIDHGLLFRTHRSIPLARIQNIDSIQNLFHRWLHVAEVRIETASGRAPEATMRVLSLRELERIRTTLQSLRLERPDQNLGPPDSTPETDRERPLDVQTVVSLTTWQLIQAGLLSNRGQILAGIALGYVWQAMFNGFEPEFDPGDPSRRDEFRKTIQQWSRDYLDLPGFLQSLSNTLGLVGSALVVLGTFILGIVLLRLFSAAWYLLKFHGYRLSLCAEELHIQCGLFTKVSVTIPCDRIQVISIQQSWLSKRFRLASIRIETSGGLGGEHEDASKTMGTRWFVPILPEADIPKVLDAFHPGMAAEIRDLSWRVLSSRAWERMIRIPIFMTIVLLLAGFWMSSLFTMQLVLLWIATAVMLICVSIWYCVLKSKSRSYARSDRFFVYKSGVLTQKRSFGQFNRVQSLMLVQSPFDRRWKMATLSFDTAGAGAANHLFHINMLDADWAKDEFLRLTHRIE